MQILQATKQPVWAVAFSPDGRTLAAGGGKADARVWNLAKTGRPHKLMAFNSIAIAFSRNDRLVMSCWGGDPRILQWPGGEQLCTAKTWPVYASYSVAITADEHIIHGTHQKLACWDLATGEQLWEGNPGAYWTRLAAGPGDRLAVVTDFRNLQLWDRVRGLRTTSKELTSEGGVLALAFSPDGRTLVLSSAFNLHLWDVETWTECKRLNLSVPCTHLAYHPSGDMILGSTHSTLRLWDSDLSREIRVYDFGLSTALDLKFAPDGLRAAAGGPNGQVLLWDID